MKAYREKYSWKIKICWKIADTNCKFSFVIKMTTKNETWDVVIIWLFSEFLFHLFSFSCWRIKFLLSVFFFQLQFWFFYQWWQIINQNVVLFMKKLWCRWVMMNDYGWPYHVVHKFQSEYTLYSCLNFKELLARKRHHIWYLNPLGVLLDR